MDSVRYDFIFLSPHLDDATLSCGGTIHAQGIKGKRVLVVTLFAGSPADAELTAYASELRERWGGDAEPVAIRRLEDQAAMARLGSVCFHLQHLDCVYRQDPVTCEPIYATEESIFGPVHALEDAYHLVLLDSLTRHVRLGDATVFAPLAVGHHVDHRLTHRAAKCLAVAGHTVMFYEDFPYAGQEQATREALAQYELDAWRQVIVPLTKADVAAKSDAISCYATQRSTFWDDWSEMRAMILDHATQPGGGLAERYWEVISDRGATSNSALAHHRGD